MFERATLIHPGIVDGKLDVGRILESMLYYGRIEALVDARVFTGLWDQLGPDGANDLLSYPSLDVELTAEMPGIFNNSRNGIKTHAAQFMSAAGHGEDRFDPTKDPVRSLHHLINNRNATPIAVVEKLIKRFPITTYTKVLANAPTRGDLFESLISDSESMREFLAAWARTHALPINADALSALQVEVISTPEGYLIANNIDLDEVVIRKEPITGWDEILPLAQDYAYDLHLSQARSADVITNQTNSYIASQRIDLSINRATRVDEIKSSFEEFAFDEARPFREAFNEGRLNLGDALKVIDQTAKFREWLNGLPPNADVIKEYHRAVTKETILDKLPGRGTRFAFFTGAGVALDLVATGGAATLVGLGLSAFDSFVLDGVLKGWRPNHFVSTMQKALDANKQA